MPSGSSHISRGLSTIVQEAQIPDLSLARADILNIHWCTPSKMYFSMFLRARVSVYLRDRVSSRHVFKVNTDVFLLGSRVYYRYF